MWNGLKVTVAFRGFWVFSPDCDISIVYGPLCACQSPNRDSENTESHERRSITYWRANFVFVCVFPGTLSWGLCSNSQWSFISQIQNVLLQGWDLSAEQSARLCQREQQEPGEGVKDKERLSIKWMTLTSQLGTECSWHFALLVISCNYRWSEHSVICHRESLSNMQHKPELIKTCPKDVQISWFGPVPVMFWFKPMCE